MSCSGVLRAIASALVVAASVQGQALEMVSLDNGAIFEGTVVLETDHFLDMNIGPGRIRLYKAWIKSRSGPDNGSEVTAVGTGTQDPKQGDPDPDEAKSRENRFPTWLRDGAASVVPLRNLHRYVQPASSSEEAALTFCRHFQQGRAADVLEGMANPLRILETAFPNGSRGLTSYSRRLAAKLLIRVLLATCSRSGIRDSLGHARLTARRTPGSKKGSDIVEVSFHLGGGEEPVVIHIEVQDGKIIDLSKGPPPVPAVLDEIRLALKLTGGKSWHLVPLLEKVVETEVTRSLPGGDGASGTDPVASARREVWSLRPKDRRYVMTLPWSWEPAAEDKTPAYADFVLHSQDGRCAATAVTESGVVPLKDLEQLVTDQFRRNLGAINVSSRKEIALGGSRALRLRIEAKSLETPLTYEVLLLVIQNRACQYAAWCKSSEHEELAPTLEALFEGLRFLN